MGVVERIEEALFLVVAALLDRRGGEHFAIEFATAGKAGLAEELVRPGDGDGIAGVNDVEGAVFGAEEASGVEGFDGVGFPADFKVLANRKESRDVGIFLS